MGWLYEWQPVAGMVARLFGPTEWGWQWELCDGERRLDEGVTPTRLGALDCITEHARADRDEIIVAGLRLVSTGAGHSGT